MSDPNPNPNPSSAAHSTPLNLNALLQLPPQMELSQIELIYRAEGNANLVLALPQFKKVLRLPKMISSRQTQPPTSQSQSQSPAQDDSQDRETAGKPKGDEGDGVARPEEQPSFSGEQPTKASNQKAGVLTMPDFMAYIEIMRCLLGNEFVCAADIVAIPKEDDRFWINEHIRAHRPVERLDKEFVGPFGLLLPDVTQLPATFDVLLANLQAKDMNTDTDTNADICNDSATSSSSSSSSSARCRTCSDDSGEAVECLGDTYAIEIKPKQGWLQLASDVSDLFDLMPAEKTMEQKEKEPGEKVKKALPPDRGTSRCKCRCRYCSMQLLKLHMGKIKRLGDYCPLELFSGAPSRMVDALNALFACPQNNLRVFQSGNLIYGDHANSISCEDLHTRLFPPAFAFAYKGNCYCIEPYLGDVSTMLQRHFDYMWQKGYAQHATPTYQALKALLSCQPFLANNNLDELPAEQAYLLGATALDCSIMLTFQEIRCQPRHNRSLKPWLVALQGRQFLTKLSVLDLDPKPDSHFCKFLKQTRQIEKCCRALN